MKKLLFVLVSLMKVSVISMLAIFFILGFSSCSNDDITEGDYVGQVFSVTDSDVYLVLIEVPNQGGEISFSSHIVSSRKAFQDADVLVDDIYKFHIVSYSYIDVGITNTFPWYRCVLTSIHKE